MKRANWFKEKPAMNVVRWTSMRLLWLDARQWTLLKCWGLIVSKVDLHKAVCVDMNGVKHQCLAYILNPTGTPVYFWWCHKDKVNFSPSCCILLSSINTVDSQLYLTQRIFWKGNILRRFNGATRIRNSWKRRYSFGEFCSNYFIVFSRFECTCSGTCNLQWRLCIT